MSRPSHLGKFSSLRRRRKRPAVPVQEGFAALAAIAGDQNAGATDGDCLMAGREIDREGKPVHWAYCRSGPSAYFVVVHGDWSIVDDGRAATGFPASVFSNFDPPRNSS